MIAIKDSGMGMTEESIGRIFEPFFASKDQSSGTGLGLATVYNIVKQSSGYIQVQSKVGLGSEFRVFLPRVESSEPGTPETDTTAPLQHSTTSLLIMVVEDEQSVLDMAAVTLRAQGHTVLTASGPLEALRIFEHFSDDIDLLLTDVVMPEMTGPEMAKLMRGMRPDLHLVFMSGYADEHIKSCNFPGERIPFIMKPFNPAEMTRIISTIIEQTGTSGTEITHE